MKNEFDEVIEEIVTSSSEVNSTSIGAIQAPIGRLPRSNDDALTDNGDSS